MKKRIVSTLMALCMVLTLLPVQVLAAGGAAPQHQLDSTTIGQYTTLGNGVYTLTEDVSISSTLKITGEATLDLNGNTLTMTGDQKAIRVGDGAKLTLRDSGTDGKLTAPRARGVTVAESGTLVMEGGSIVGCQAGDVGGGGVHNSGTFIMKSGTISGCNGSVGGGVYNSYGTFTMEGGSISRCEAADRSGRMGDGDGVYNSGTFTMSGSAEITECRTNGVYNTGTMNANGGSIQTASGSTALYNNGAGTVQTESGSTGTVFKTQVTNEGVISGGTFEDQVTSKRGTISGGNFRLDVSIQRETTVTGGVFEGDVSIQGGTVSGGTFKGKVTKHVDGTISGGTFEETSDVLSYGTIDPGVTFPGKVTVTYMTDGAVYAQHFPKHGTTARQPGAKPGKTDYTFDGWLKADGTAYDFKQPVTENITLTAKWKLTSYTEVSSETELRDALTQKKAGIRLANDIQLTQGTLKITYEVTLDLNGKVLAQSVDGSVFVIGNEEPSESGKLTVVDSDPRTVYKFKPNDTSHLWERDDTGDKTVTGGIIYGGRANRGGGVNIENGTLIMEGGSIVGCQVIYTNASGSGGGVHVSDQSSFEMYPGAGIYGCVASGYGAGDGSGGGVEIDSGWEKSGRFVMHDGTIESCVAGEKGGGVSNDGVFVMEGGIIRNCVAIGYEEGYGSSIRFGGITTISGGTISAEGAEGKKQHIFGSRSTLTISGDARVDVSIYLECVLYADGGTVNGEVTNKKSIIGSEGATGTTTFTKKVESYSSIENGVFAGAVESEGTISGGTFKDAVMNKVGSTIEGGTFEKKVTSYGTIENGVFKGEVTNGGTITGGTFKGVVTCEGHTSNGSNGPLVGGTVSGGSFKNPIQVIYGTIIGPEYKWTEKEPSYGEQYVLTYQADGEAYAWQVLGEDFFPVMPQGPDKEGHTFLSWFYKGGKHDGEMVDEGDPPNENRTAVARYATGSGTEQDPCRIGGKEELEFFAVQVDRFGSTGLCAVLTNDIVINSGTFDEAGQYTPAANETASRVYTIGSKERPYTGIFDGGGYTIRGVYRDNREDLNSLYYDAVYPAGLFGWLKGTTVKNLTVTGYVGGRACVGGIAGHADAGTTILNCRNECIVVSVDLFGEEYGPAQYAGGIVGYNEGKVTACCNTGTVTGADSVGGIAGGLAGTVSYCYNVGAVTGGVEIANDATVSKCFFLGTQGMSAEKFANGTVLAALIDGRADDAHPWDTECVGKRLSDGGMRLPVLAWQKLSAAHEGGTATCTEKAVCTLCGHAYGTVDANNHVGGTELRNAKKATCTEDGHTGDTYCKGCGVKLQSGTAIKATGHTGGTATCVSAAVCTVCGQAYGKKDAGNHDLKHTAAKAPGIYARGNTEYWQCKACGKYFADANGTKTISQSDTVIPPRGRTAESGSENGKSSPGTFDAGIGVYGVTAVTSLTGLALLRRKRRDEE